MGLELAGSNKENVSVESVAPYLTANMLNPFFPKHQLFSEDESSIKLLKLHGSINWKTNNDGSSNMESFIVPPTWNKSDSRIKNLWRIAHEELKSAKRIIVIGYSFPETDIYVKSLLALALNGNKILQKIVFINPDNGIAKKASLDLLDRHFEKYCEYKEWKLTDFLNAGAGKKFVESSLNRKIKD